LLGVIFAFAGVWLLHGFLRTHGITLGTSLLLSTLYLIHNDAPLRSSLVAPLSLTSATHLLLLLGLMLLQRRAHWMWMLLFTLCAVPTREFTLVFPLLFVLVGRGPRLDGRSKKTIFTDAMPLLLGIALFIGLSRQVAVTPTIDFLTGGPYSFFQHALRTVYAQTFVRILFSACLAFGPLLWLVVYRWDECSRALREQPLLLRYLLLVFALAFVGGTDTPRFMFWGFPVVYWLCARVWDKALIPRGFRVLTVWLVLLSERAFWALPHAVLTAGQLCRDRSPCEPYEVSPGPMLNFLTDNYQVLDLHPYWGTRGFILVALAQHLVCIGLLVFVQRVADRQRLGPPARAAL
jgi:hypothetical protein